MSVSQVIIIFNKQEFIKGFSVNRECKRANNESIEAISTCQCPSSSLPASSESPSPAPARLQIKPFLSGSAMSLKKGEQDVRKPRSLRNNKALKAKGNDQKLRGKYNQDTKQKTKGHKQNIKSNQRKRRVQIRKRKLKLKDKKRKRPLKIKSKGRRGGERKYKEKRKDKTRRKIKKERKLTKGSFKTKIKVSNRSYNKYR